MPRKLTSACNVNAVGCVLLHDAMATAGHEKTYGILYKGLEADTRRTQARSRRTQGRQTAKTRRTKCGDAAKAESRRTQGGQWRTHGGQAPGTQPEHIAASLFSSKREPHSKLLGEKGVQTCAHVSSCLKPPMMSRRLEKRGSHAKQSISSTSLNFWYVVSTSFYHLKA